MSLVNQSAHSIHGMTERFAKTRKDFTIEEIPHEQLPEEEKLTYQDMLDEYGDSPF